MKQMLVKKTINWFRVGDFSVIYAGTEERNK